VDQEVERFEFGSPGWIAAFKALMPRYVAKVDPQVRLSVCEVLTNVPAHLDHNGDGRIAWHFRIADSRVEFGDGYLEDVDHCEEADYDFILPEARQTYTPERMEEVRARRIQGAAEGKVKTRRRDGLVMPAELVAMHNEMAIRTL
jgi:hypothetical protein